MSQFDALTSAIEGIVIGNDCMLSDTSISFSRFQNVRVIDVGYDSLSDVDSLSLSGMLIDD